MRGVQDPEWVRSDDPNAVHVTESEAIIICDGSNSGEVFSGFTGALASTMAKIEPKVPIDQTYLRRFLESNAEVFAGNKTGTAIPHLDQEAMFKLQIPMPPLSEQQRIVRLLDEAFEGIAIAKANAEKNLQNAHELLNSQMQALLGQVDNEWREVQLETLCTVDWGNTKLTKSAYVEGGEYLAVSAAGCDGRIGHKEHAKFTPVLSAIGAQCGRMFLPDEDFTAIKNTITLTPKDGTCTGKFLYRLLTYVELPKRGAAQPFISKGDIQTFSVNVPPLTTQERVVELVEKLEKHTDELTQVYGKKLAKLDVLKHSLLHQAFTGDSKVLS
jgi:type I restriction enzyme S subunit